MKLIPYEMSKIEMGVYSRSANREILEEFANSGLDCAKVTNFTQKTAHVCTTSLNNSIKRYRMYSLRAISRRGEVFIIRETK